MPALSPGQETGIFLEWLKQEGDSIEKGEPLMEVETDKANVEVEAPAEGTLSNISVKPGDEIQVGEVIALILEDGEYAPASLESVEKNETQSIEKAAPQQTQKSDSSESSENCPTKKIAASPKIKQYAKKEGIDLTAIKGSGPSGAILMEDVQAVQSQQETGVNDFSVSKGWQLMADRLKESWTSAPHFSLIRNLDAGSMVAYKNQIQANIAKKVTYTDLLVQLAAVSLKEHPRVNASLIDNRIVNNSEINIGVAVATEDGLIVPVIHKVDELSLEEITELRADLVARTQQGKLRSGEMDSGTFTISNLGMLGVDSFNAIINPPQSAILAVGKLTDQVVPMDGQAVIRPMLSVNASFDHRVVDGARGAMFMQTLSNLIENLS
ncbi:MAG: Dihydrolipoyllysine-residue acetyltransferase component of pyruvate dehydrogenase complex [Deltaproteobacteria bacterium]|jgi:pyruvate dehydrogenase E2 component (dihydrolipoamide acetyltransferase)|nr:Dihydrolipoyllysine-residue acetyltransferase component of pyruvate dehydrogenase complex [Deltaproteobacteria bacterium]